MAETIYSYALTTVARVKNRANITSSASDTEIARLINSATDVIENYCKRRFAQATYTNEIYSVYSYRQKFVILKNAPAASISSFQYRAGTPSTPSWTDFITDQYILENNGNTARIRIYGWAPYETNSVRVTYQGGYAIDWANAGNSSHQLPGDLTDACERLVIRMLHRREQDAIKETSSERNKVVYKDEMFDDELKGQVGLYKRLYFI